MSNGAPFSCDYAYGEYDGRIPTGVNIRNNKTFQFFQKYLLQIVYSRFEFNLPETWDEDYFYNTVFVHGKVAVFNAKRFGVIPQSCSLGGYNVFYKPANAYVCNPLIPGTNELKIGKECEIIHINPDFSGIMDIVDFYAEMMALTAETTQTNIENSKLAYVFCAENKGLAESFKRLFDKIQSGEPAVVADKNLFSANGNLAVQMFNQSLNGTFIADKLMDSLQNWEYEFCKKIGVSTQGVEKSQYVSNDAIQKENKGSSSLCEEWLRRMKKCTEKVNEMFGTNVSVSLREEKEEKENDSEAVGTPE